MTVFSSCSAEGSTDIGVGGAALAVLLSILAVLALATLLLATTAAIAETPDAWEPPDPGLLRDAAFRAEMTAFVRVLAGEEAPASTHHDAYQDLRVAVACDRSLAEGRTVLLEEIT